MTESLTEADIEGLKETIEIVNKHFKLISPHNQDAVMKNLRKAEEIAKRLKIKMTIPLDEQREGKEGKEEEETTKTAKDILGQLKKDADELLKKVKNQKGIFENFQKEEYIATKVDKKISTAFSKLYALKEIYKDKKIRLLSSSIIGSAIENELQKIVDETKKSVDSIISEISDLIKLDKWMERRQEIAVNNLLNIDQQIKELVWHAGQINENIFTFIKGKADESNPLYRNSKEMETVIAELLSIGNILSKEDSAVRRIGQFMAERKEKEEKMQAHIEQAKGIMKTWDSGRDMDKKIDIVEGIDNMRRLLENDNTQIKEADSSIVALITEFKPEIESIIGLIENLEKQIEALKEAVSPSMSSWLK